LSKLRKFHKHKNLEKTGTNIYSTLWHNSERRFTQFTYFELLYSELDPATPNYFTRNLG